MLAAQDDYALYVVRSAPGASVINRVAKDGGIEQPITTSPLRITAIDVDGPRVYYGTGEWPIPEHQRIVSMTIFGGEPSVLLDDAGWILWLAHDETHLYWIELVSESDCALRRMSKRGGAVETLATNLRLTFRSVIGALGDDVVLAAANDSLHAVHKDGSQPLQYPPSAIDVLTWGGAVYYVNGYLGRIVRVTEDFANYRAVNVGGFAERIYMIAGGRLYYSAFSGGDRMRDICGDTEQASPISFAKSGAVLADSCAIYEVRSDRIERHEMPPGPRIDGISPSHGLPGEPITIRGSGFDRLTATVTLDGVEMLLQSVESDTITAVVPQVPSRWNEDVVAVRNGSGPCTGAYFDVDRPE